MSAAVGTAGLAAAKVVQAQGAVDAAEGNLTRVRHALAAAVAHYWDLRGQWDRLIGSAESLHEEMHRAATTAQDIIDGQKGAAFEENPSGISGFFAKVGDWLDEHADLLKTLSDILTTVGGIVAMFPGIGTAIGAALIGVGMVMKLALTLNGNMSWGEFAMSAASVFITGAHLAANSGSSAASTPAAYRKYP